MAYLKFWMTAAPPPRLYLNVWIRHRVDKTKWNGFLRKKPCSTGPQALVGPLYVFGVAEQGRVVGEGGGKEKVKRTNMRAGQGSASHAP